MPKELLEPIIQHVSENTADLAAMARTCRALHSTAKAPSYNIIQSNCTASLEENLRLPVHFLLRTCIESPELG